MPASASPSCTLATTAFTFSSCDTTFASTRRSYSGGKPGAPASFASISRLYLPAGTASAATTSLTPRRARSGRPAIRAGLVRGTIATRRFRAKISARALDQPLLRDVAHPALVGRREHVGRSALLDLQGELLRAGEVELHRQSRVARFENATKLAEGLGERGGGVDRERRRSGARCRGGRRPWPVCDRREAEDHERQLDERVHAWVAPFPIMTSVDLMTAMAISPTLRPSRSAELRVITATSSWSPIAIRTSAMRPSAWSATIRPRS